MLGVILPEQVREQMERSNIFLATSNYYEGWGAVVNEAINSGCAVIASNAMGCVPFLIKNKENGLIYKHSNNIDELYNHTQKLILNKDLQIELGINAYKYISEEYNHNIAATRLITFSEELINNDNAILYDNGIMSNAKVLEGNKN